ncbi:MAG: hypothetical protein ACRDUV_00050, partial [Pseudonocardiaceae bacterium]
MPDGPPDERFVYLSDVLPTSWQAVEYAGVPAGGFSGGIRRGLVVGAGSPSGVDLTATVECVVRAAAGVPGSGPGLVRRELDVTDISASYCNVGG